MECTLNLFMGEGKEIILTDKYVLVFQPKGICHRGPNVGMTMFWRKSSAKVRQISTINMKTHRLVLSNKGVSCDMLLEK